MAKTETIRARVEPDLKARVEAVLDELGISTTEAITLFFTQIVIEQGIPFEVRIPNATTQKAIRDAQAGRGLTYVKDVDELRKRFGT